MARVLVSGSLAYDRIMNFPGIFSEHIIPEKAHELNVSFQVDNLKESYGGTAGNIAYNLALLGEKPAIVARAGNDFAPYRKWLAEHGIDIARIEEDAEDRTAFASIMTDQKDNQITAFYMGAMRMPTKLVLEPLAGDMAILGAGNIEDMRALPALFRSSRIPFIFDPGQGLTALSGEDLKNGIEGSQALISNDYELALIMKKTGWNEEEILTHTDMLVTTFGAEGSQAKTKETTVRVPAAKPKNTNDPTGAGDAYRAGFIHGLLKGLPLEQILKLAGLVACYTVETYGTQTHTFSKDELKARYKENFNEEIEL